MKKILLALVCFTSILISCNEDKIIDETTNEFKVLVATGGQSPKLALYDYNTMSIMNPDLMQNVNSIALPGEITKISSFAGNIYLLAPEAYKVIVLSAKDYKLVSTLDFTADNLKPTDICFPNATDAYISHSNSNKVSLIDITVFKKAREIEVGDNPVSIASSGNQVYTANMKGNSISILDTRTRNQTFLIKDVKSPVLADITGDGSQAVVIAAGSGKYDNEPKTDAEALFIDINTGLIAKRIPLTADKIKAVDVKPVSIANTAKEWSFIVTDQQLIRVDTRTDYRVALVNRKLFSKIMYDIKRRQLMMIENRDGASYLMTADEGSGASKSSKLLPSGTSAIYPI